MADILFSALAARTGGGLTYVRNIVRAFPANAEDRLWILSPAPIDGLIERPNVKWLRAPRWTRRPVPRFLLGFFYFRFLWPHRNDFDVVYYAGGSRDVALPPAVRTVVAFRNMLPFDLPARRRFPLGRVRMQHWLLRILHERAMRRADSLIFISEHGRRVVDRAIEGRPGRSIVIPHGVARTDVPLPEAVAGRLPERFVLYLSPIGACKAQVELVEAWARLRKDRRLREKLVLAGTETFPYAREVRGAIRRHGLDEEVVLLGHVRHDQVFDLAERAVLNLFLSSCENCPNTLLELMRAGRPLLASSCQPMPEFGSDALEYVDPYDVPALAAALGRLLDDPALRARIAAAAYRRSRMFSWNRSGAMTWSVIQAAGRWGNRFEPAAAAQDAIAPAPFAKPLPLVIRR